MSLCLALTSAALLPASSVNADWPQFRGPTGDGVAAETGLPLTWSETENVAWKVALPGVGRSSPVILGDRIWLTAAIKKPATGAPGAKAPEIWSLNAICLDRVQGKTLSQVELLSIDKPEPIHPFNSYATPTPVLEPDRLYCDAGTYGTVCLDSTANRVLWRARLPVDHQLGPASSPVVYRDWLFLVRDGIDKQYVAALDKRTGQTVWQNERPPFEAEGPAFRKSFSTPLVVEAQGGAQVIIPGPHWIVAYAPATGEELWRVDHGKGYSIAPRPVFGHGLVYVCTGDYVPQLWAIRVDGRGDVTRTHVAWKVTSQIPLMSSPLLVGGELYVVSDAGVLSCLDALTGTLHWRERLGGNYAASPTSADGRIYFFNREGRATLLRPGKEFSKLAENQLDGSCIASPAITGRALFLRTDTHLYCLQTR